MKHVIFLTVATTLLALSAGCGDQVAPTEVGQHDALDGLVAGKGGPPSGEAGIVFFGRERPYGFALTDGERRVDYNLDLVALCQEEPEGPVEPGVVIAQFVVLDPENLILLVRYTGEDLFTRVWDPVPQSCGEVLARDGIYAEGMSQFRAGSNLRAGDFNDVTPRADTDRITAKGVVTTMDGEVMDLNTHLTCVDTNTRERQCSVAINLR